MMSECVVTPIHSLIFCNEQSTYTPQTKKSDSLFSRIGLSKSMNKSFILLLQLLRTEFLQKLPCGASR